MILDIIGIACIWAGLFVFMMSVFGIYRLKYVLNRLHAAALSDTLGMGLIVLGLMFLTADLFPVLKLLLVIIFLWISAPIATHMIGRIEFLTNKNHEERIKDK